LGEARGSKEGVARPPFDSGACACLFQVEDRESDLIREQGQPERRADRVRLAYVARVEVAGTDARDEAQPVGIGRALKEDAPPTERHGRGDGVDVHLRM